jgi:flagellar protein FlbT
MMGLRITLKRGEKLFVAGGSIQNEHQNIVLFIEGDLPVLRESEIVSAETADTPAKRLVLALQQIYLTKRGDELHEIYIVFARDVLRAFPEGSNYIARIDDLVSAEDYFKALKEARALVEFEASLKPAPSKPSATPERKKRALGEVASVT